MARGPRHDPALPRRRSCSAGAATARSADTSPDAAVRGWAAFTLGPMSEPFDTPAKQHRQLRHRPRPRQPALRPDRTRRARGRRGLPLIENRHSCSVAKPTPNRTRTRPADDYAPAQRSSTWREGHLPRARRLVRATGSMLDLPCGLPNPLVVELPVEVGDPAAVSQRARLCALQRERSAGGLDRRGAPHCQNPRP